MRADDLEARRVRLGLRVLQSASPALAARVAERLFMTARAHPRPMHEQALLAEANAFRLTVGEGWVPAWAWGEGPATILLVHGWEGRGAQLGAFVPPLVAAGYRVVAFDGPGHGAGSLRVASAVDHAEAISAALDACGPVAGIVAHSFGGFATTIALATSAREHARSSLRLVYVASPIDATVWLTVFSSSLGLRDDVVQKLRRRLERRFRAPLEHFDGRLLGAGLPNPLLLVHDEDDVEVSIRTSRALADAWPGARLLATKGLGHRRILRAPKVVADVASFFGDPTPEHGALRGTLEAELYDPESRRVA